MDIKDLIPLIGVAVGWMLSEASTHTRISRENRKTINKAITTLLQMRIEIKRAKFLLQGGQNYYKENFSETHRKHLMELHLQPLALEPHLKVAEELAGVNPLLSVKLHGLLVSQKAFMSQNLKAIEATPELYEFMLSLFNDLYEKSTEKLKEMILRLALQQSLFTWARYSFFFRFQETEMENWGEHADKIAKDFIPMEEEA
ncbi:hypothetical protein [Shewanella frigidimarina]|uniref:hypothetical protein n=1 Tax=Shewanella frigidimarina TaxID=56812 RepID=UPI003D7A4009